jgi:organic hydroperoxide reductase OsmC/OhrA
MSTFLAFAERAGLAFASYESDAEGRVELVAGKLQVTSVTLTPRVTVQSSGDVDKAKEFLTKAESNCLISNSVKSHITMNPTVSSAEL